MIIKEIVSARDHFYIGNITDIINEYTTLVIYRKTEVDIFS